MTDDLEGSLDDPDEIAQLFEEMTLYMEPTEQPEDPGYAAMNRIELLTAWSEVNTALANHKALIHAETEEDQDLQGRYYGLLLEMRKRGMK